MNCEICGRLHINEAAEIACLSNKVKALNLQNGELQKMWESEREAVKNVTAIVGEVTAEKDAALRQNKELQFSVRDLLKEIERLNQLKAVYSVEAFDNQAKLREKDRLIDEVRAVTRRWQNTEIGDTGAIAEVCSIVNKTERPKREIIFQTPHSKCAVCGWSGADEDAMGYAAWSRTYVERNGQLVCSHCAEKRLGSSPTERPCCVEAYARGYDVGRASR